MIEQDLKILTNIHQTLSVDPHVNQRELAKKSNISLGQMNAVLKRCIARGWIAVKNLNMKKVCYYLTPSGMEEVSIRTSHYMMNTFSLMNEYASRIQSALEKIRCQGKTTVVLVGRSNIDFLIEYTCEKLDLRFIKTELDRFECDIIGNDVFALVGESVEMRIENVNSVMDLINKY